MRGDETGMRRQQPKCSVEVEDSKHNPNMEIQKSALGVCSVHKVIRARPAHTVVNLDGDGWDGWDGGGPESVRILCLDGGGMKVIMGSMLFSVTCSQDLVSTSKSSCYYLSYDIM